MAENSDPSLHADVDERPWGRYIVLADAPDHKVKRITVLPGKRLSLQRHRRRNEHWYIVTGEAEVTVGKQELRLGPGILRAGII